MWCVWPSEETLFDSLDELSNVHLIFWGGKGGWGWGRLAVKRGFDAGHIYRIVIIPREVGTTRSPIPYVDNVIGFISLYQIVSISIFLFAKGPLECLIRSI